jgi:integrase
VRRGLTFGDLAQHYAEHELVECSESIRPKAHTTIKGYERVLRNRLLPRWGNRIALGIEPLEVEQWLRALKKEGDLANPTLDKTRRVMSLVYEHGQRYGLLPRNPESNPMRFVRCKTTSGYEAMILTPEQAYAIVCNLREPERTLTLLAAGTGLRISECLGLQWHDVNFADGMIHVRRTWTCGQVGLPKSQASKGPVPLHRLLAEFMLLWKQKTTYAQAGDWVFPSTRLNGKQPRVATCLSKIICGQPLSRRVFFHRTRTITADSWMTTRDDSVFIICDTASRHFSSGSEPIQRLCKLCLATATSN